MSDAVGDELRGLFEGSTLRARDIQDLSSTPEGAVALAEDLLNLMAAAYADGRLSLLMLNLSPGEADRLAAFMGLLEGDAGLDGVIVLDN